MNYLLLNLILALAWSGLSGEFGPTNMLIGLLLGYLVLFVSRRAIGPTDYFIKVPLVFAFAGYFLRELVVANVRVAYDVLTPQPRMQPRIVALPLRARTPAEITALSYLISLTPGTLSMDVSTDRKVLYIHAMYARDPDAVRHELTNGIERRLLQVMRGRHFSGANDEHSH
jgi:multicomponent Na+:H+ antiporter subunit E